MIPSACNIADYLARWDAGQHRRLRAQDERHGGRPRPQADPLRGRQRGRTPARGAPPFDQAILGAYAMGVPGMVSIEDHPDMAFPVEGMAPNYNPALGQDGVIGLKSGFTDAAQICLVAAAPAHGRRPHRPRRRRDPRPAHEPATGPARSTCSCSTAATSDSSRGRSCDAARSWPRSWPAGPNRRRELVARRPDHASSAGRACR